DRYDRRLAHRAHKIRKGEHLLPVLSISIAFGRFPRLDRASEAGDICTSTERPAGTSHYDRADISVVIRPPERLYEIPHHRGAESVQLVGTVQRDGRDPVRCLVQNLLILHKGSRALLFVFTRLADSRLEPLLAPLPPPLYFTLSLARHRSP